MLKGQKLNIAKKFTENAMRNKLKVQGQVKVLLDVLGDTMENILDENDDVHEEEGNNNLDSLFDDSQDEFEDASEV